MTLHDTIRALTNIDPKQIDATVSGLQQARRVFAIGNGGGHAHASHFVSDLRHLANRDAYSFDNLGEITARVNDDGWANAWSGWLTTSLFNPSRDLLFVFSVGGGNEAVSANLVGAMELADRVYGIVGAAGGEVARHGTPIVVPSFDTSIIESCQSVIAHLLVDCLR